MRSGAKFGDRRAAPRLPRLLKFRVEHARRIFDAVTADVSADGAFLTAPGRVFPPAGSTISLRPAGHDVIARAVVRRTLQPGSPFVALAGFAVVFESFESDAGARALGAFIAELGSPAAALDGITMCGSTATYHPSQPTRTSRLLAEHPHLAPERLVLESIGRSRMIHWSGTERRRHERLLVHAEVRWYEDHVPYAGNILSVSPGGFFLQTDHTLPRIGARLRIEMPIPDAPPGVVVQLGAVVARRSGPEDGLPGVGAQLKHVDERGRLGVFRLWLRRQTLRQRPSPGPKSPVFGA